MKLRTRLLLATAFILGLLSTANPWLSYRVFDGLVDEEMATIHGLCNYWIDLVRLPHRPHHSGEIA